MVDGDRSAGLYCNRSRHRVPCAVHISRGSLLCLLLLLVGCSDSSGGNTPTEPTSLEAPPGDSSEPCVDTPGMGGDTPPADDAARPASDVLADNTCLIESFAFSVSRFGRDYQDSLVELYSGENITGDLTVLSTQSLSDESIDTRYSCPAGGELNTVDTGDALAAVNGGDFSRRFNYDACSVAGGLYAGTVVRRSEYRSLPPDDESAIMRDSFSLEFSTDALSEFIMGDFTTRFVSFQDESANGELVLSTTRQFNDISLSYSERNEPEVLITAASGGYRRYNLNQGQIDETTISGQHVLEGCYQRDLDGNIAAFVDATVEVSFTSPMKLLGQQNRVLSGIIRFDTADGDLVVVRASDDPAMAQVSRSFNDAEPIVDRVAWDTLLP